MLGVVGSEPAEPEGDGRSLLDDIAREGARRMLAAALEAEVAAYVEAHAAERDAKGHALVVNEAPSPLNATSAAFSSGPKVPGSGGSATTTSTGASTAKRSGRRGSR